MAYTRTSAPVAGSSVTPRMFPEFVFEVVLTLGLGLGLGLTDGLGEADGLGEGDGFPPVLGEGLGDGLGL